MNYDFAKVISKIHNSGQTHSLVLCGNIYDLFFDEKEYVPLIPYLLNRNKTDNIIQITYELNGPIRILTGANKLRNAWITYRQQLKESEQPKAWTTELVQAVKQQALPTDYGKEFDERLMQIQNQKDNTYKIAKEARNILSNLEKTGIRDDYYYSNLLFINLF